MNIKVGIAARRTHAERTGEAITRLTRAAMELISEEGMKGLTLAAVGARAGVSRELARYHFGSKAGLVRHLLDTIFEKRLKFYADSSKAGMTGIEIIFASMDRLPQHAENPAEYRGLLVLLMEGAVDPDREVRQRILDYSRAVRLHLIENFRSALIENNMSPDPMAEVLAASHMSAIRGIAFQWFLERDLAALESSAMVLKQNLRRILAEGLGEEQPKNIKAKRPINRSS